MNDLLALAHNTAHDLGRINNTVWLIENNLDKIEDSKLRDYIQKKLDVIKSSNLHIQTEIDTYYTKNKC